MDLDREGSISCHKELGTSIFLNFGATIMYVHLGGSKCCDYNDKILTSYNY